MLLMVGKIFLLRIFANYFVDPTSHGFWKSGCGEQYVFGKSVVSYSFKEMWPSF